MSTHDEFATPARPRPWLSPYDMAELDRALPGEYDRIQRWHRDWLRTVTRVGPPAQPLCLIRQSGS